MYRIPTRIIIIAMYKYMNLTMDEFRLSVSSQHFRDDRITELRSLGTVVITSLLLKAFVILLLTNSSYATVTTSSLVLMVLYYFLLEIVPLVAITGFYKVESSNGVLRNNAIDTGSNQAEDYHNHRKDEICDENSSLLPPNDSNSGGRRGSGNGNVVADVILDRLNGQSRGGPRLSV